MNTNTINVRNEINNQLLHALHSVFNQGAHAANFRCGDTEEEKQNVAVIHKDGGYKCIHLSPHTFVEKLGSVIGHREIGPQQFHGLKFLDVGCGVGEKVYLASLFGLTTFGLELREPLIEEGKKLFKSIGHYIERDQPDGARGQYNYPLRTNCFIQGNALEYDYKDFDILYFYCPLFNPELQQKLELQIAKTAKKGAIVIPALAKGCFQCYVPKHKDLPDDWQLFQISSGYYFVRGA